MTAADLEFILERKLHELVAHAYDIARDLAGPDAEWEVQATATSNYDSPGPGWQPFSVTQGRLLWRRRVCKETP